MSNVKYRSGNFAEARAIGGIRHESPLLPYLNEVLIFHQDYMQLESAFVAEDYNTINPDIAAPKAFLINESPREDAKGNCVHWTRSWARIPSSYDLPGGIYQFEFPGFNGIREPIVISVALTIHRDFFLCGNNGIANGGFAEWQDIPINEGLKIYKGGEPSWKTNILSTTTTPTLAAYQALVAGGNRIQIEDSKITPWQGSIFVREDFFVIAQ